MKRLTDACQHDGLLVAGQTESLMSLEALTLELGIEPTDIHGFYSTNATATGQVSLVKYPQQENQTQALRLQGAIEAIKHHLHQNKRIYAFFSDRRDTRTLAAVFAEQNPVIYTAYTKGEKRAKAFLRNQRLTDSNLFLATSAACVGINILDPNAVTIIVTVKRFGQRPWKEVVQECLRNRARTNVEIHYTDTPVALPIKPSEAEATSLFHETMKGYKASQPGVTEHAARDYALSTLADAQPEVYLEHHLQQIAGMHINTVQGKNCDTETLQALKQQMKQATQNEADAVKERARIYLNRNEIWTKDEIRRRSINAGIDSIAHLTYEKINGYCQAVGWDGESEVELTPEQRELVVKLINDGTDTETLIKRRRGWLATRYPALYAQIFGNEKADALDADIESDALTDDRFRGQLLGKLIDGLKGRVFTQEALSFQLITLLVFPEPNVKHTPLSLIQKGALGTATYRQTRFIGRTAPTAIVKWVRKFISEWYPARIKKEYGNDAYALTPDDPAAISIFRVWAKHRYGITLYTDDGTDPPVLPGEQMKQQAQQLREQGKTVRQVATEMGLSKSKVARQTKGKKETAQDRIRKVLADGKPRQAKDIIAKANVSLRIFNLEVKKLDNVTRIRRGVYQHTN